MSWYKESKRENIDGWVYLVNPTHTELLGMFKSDRELRGLHVGKDIYFWNAYDWDHADMLDKLGYDFRILYNSEKIADLNIIRFYMISSKSKAHDINDVQISPESKAGKYSELALGRISSYGINRENIDSLNRVFRSMGLNTDTGFAFLFETFNGNGIVDKINQPNQINQVINQIPAESKVAKKEYSDATNIYYLFNPTHSEILSWCKDCKYGLRGINYLGETYIWDAYAYDHFDFMGKVYGVDIDNYAEALNSNNACLFYISKLDEEDASEYNLAYSLRRSDKYKPGTYIAYSIDGGFVRKDIFARMGFDVTKEYPVIGESFIKSPEKIENTPFSQRQKVPGNSYVLNAVASVYGKSNKKMAKESKREEYDAVSVGYDKISLEVLSDCTHDELYGYCNRMQSLRGGATNGKMYVWSAGKALHNDVFKVLPLMPAEMSSIVPFFITKFDNEGLKRAGVVDPVYKIYGDLINMDTMGFGSLKRCNFIFTDFGWLLGSDRDNQKLQSI
jgi:hypothetical protein